MEMYLNFMLACTHTAIAVMLNKVTFIEFALLIASYSTILIRECKRCNELATNYTALSTQLHLPVEYMAPRLARP